MKIYFCADDYGLSPEADRHIEECIKNGGLNSVSVFPNAPSASKCKERFEKDVSLFLHLNLVEGKALSKPEDTDILTDSRGFFRHSFFGLFFLSISHKKKKLEKQLYTEIKNQLSFWKTIAGDKPIMINSHQHTHMIPLIFKVLVKVIEDEKTDVEYIRFPSEYIFPYLKTPSLYFTYSFVNIIKQWTLKIMGLHNLKFIKKAQIPAESFMGILLSGNMDKMRVGKILSDFIRISEKKGKNAEILFHPGYVSKEDSFTIDVNPSFKKFYFSEGRKTEYDTSMTIHKILN